jgi:UDP-GlcNAc:undecaprenyl-phosphate GlcNAc-1-phosphate transferase
MDELGAYLANDVFAPSLWARNWLLPLVVSLISSIALTALLIKTARAKGWVATPRPDRWNIREVAQFGGMPILLAFSIGSLLLPHTRQTFVLLLLTWGMGLVGLVDDVAGLAPKAKLSGQALLAGLAVYAGIIHPLTLHPWLNALFTIFWIVGITNAINLLDNMDGLAAGISIVALVQIVVLAGPGAPVAVVALCLVAAIAGFMIFNINPAKIFMGDVGALSIGFFLACASVKTTEHLSSLASVLFVPCMVFFIPVFDTLLVSVTRRMNGRAISKGARDHTSHRLVLIGLSERQAVALLWAIAVGAGVMAYLWKSSWADLGAGIVALFLIGSALFWIYLAKLQLPQSWLSQGEVGFLAIPEFLQQLVTHISVVLLDTVLIILGLYFAYLSRFERLSEAVFGGFLFAAALSISIKLTLLLAFGVYQKRWSIKSRRDVYPILKAVLLSTFILAILSLALPLSKTIGSSILLIDAVFTSCLLLLCRSSTRIFDDLLTRSGFLLVAGKEGSRERPFRDSNGSVPEVPDRVQAREQTATMTRNKGRTLP